MCAKMGGQIKPKKMWEWLQQRGESGRESKKKIGRSGICIRAASPISRICRPLVRCLLHTWWTQCSASNSPSQKLGKLALGSTKEKGGFLSGIWIFGGSFLFFLGIPDPLAGLCGWKSCRSFFPFFDLAKKLGGACWVRMKINEMMGLRIRCVSLRPSHPPSYRHPSNPIVYAAFGPLHLRRKCNPKLMCKGALR